jgi:protein TonB
MRYYSLLASLILLAACTETEKPAEENNTQAKNNPPVQDNLQKEAPADSMPNMDTMVMKLPTTIPAEGKKKRKFDTPEVVQEVEMLQDRELIEEPSIEPGDIREEALWEPENDDEKIFIFVEEMPSFKTDLTKYLHDHIQYPEAARKAGIEGRVFVQFTVTKAGTVQDIEVLKRVDKELDAEAIRVLKGMPPESWTPGKQNGKAVNVRMTVPVMFKLD